MSYNVESSNSTAKLREYYDSLLPQEGQAKARYMAENTAYRPPAIGDFFDAGMNAGSYATRYLLGAGRQTAGLLGLGPRAWTQTPARDFKMATLEMSAPWATFRHNLDEGVLDRFKPDLADIPKAIAQGPMALPTKAAGALLQAAKEAVIQTAHEKTQGYPWASKNQAKVEDYALETVNPFNWLMVSHLGLYPILEHREIAALKPYAEKAMEIAGQLGRGEIDMMKARSLMTSEAVLHRVAGPDLGQGYFVEAVRDMVKRGLSADAVQDLLYHTNARTQGWQIENPHLDAVFRSPFWRSGMDLFSPEMRTSGRQYLWTVEASRNYEREVLRNNPEITQRELKQFQEIFRNVAKAEHDPMGSFVRNYNQAVRDGIIEDLPERSKEKLMKYADYISDGYLKDPNRKGWDKYYFPSKDEKPVDMKPGSGETSKGYLNQRTTERIDHDNAEDFRVAVAKVRSRAAVKEAQDSFIHWADNQKLMLEQAIENLYPSVKSDTYASLKTERDRLQTALTDLGVAEKDYDKTAGFIQGRIQALQDRIAAIEAQPSPKGIGKARAATDKLSDQAKAISDQIDQLRVEQFHYDHDGAAAKIEELERKFNEITDRAEGKDPLSLPTSPVTRAYRDRAVASLKSEIAFEQSKLNSLPKPKGGDSRYPHLVTRAQMEGRISALSDHISSIESNHGFPVDAHGMHVYPAEARQLIQQKNILTNLQRDIKLLNPNPDPLAPVKEWPLVGKLLDGYDRLTGIFVRQHTTHNPFITLHLAADGLVRAIAETRAIPAGEIAEAAKAATEAMMGAKESRIVPWFDHNAKLIDPSKADFSAAPIPMMNPVNIRPQTLGQKIRAGFGPAMEEVHGAFQKFVARHAYDKEYGYHLANGVEPATAHKFATAKAYDSVAAMKKYYDMAPGWMQVVQRPFPFLIHGANVSTHWGGLLTEDPSLYWALARGRQAQKDMSPGGEGFLPITSSGMIDPAKPTTLGRFLDTPDRLSNAFSRPEPLEWQLYRGAQAIALQPQPLFDIAMQLMGAAPPKEQHLLSPTEQAAAFVAGTDTPSRAVYQTFGLDNSAGKDAVLNKRVNMTMDAAAKGGNPITEDEARAQIKRADTINSMTIPMGYKMQTREEAEATRMLHGGLQMMRMTEPELKPAFRNRWVVEMQNNGFTHADQYFSRDPESKYQATMSSLEKQRGDAKALLDSPEAKARELSNIFLTTPIGKVLNSIMNWSGSPAGAEPVDMDKYKAIMADVKAEQEKSKDAPPRQVAYQPGPGRTVVPVSKNIGADVHDSVEMARAEMFLDKIPSVEKRYEWIKQNPTLQQAFANRATTDRTAGFYSSLVKAGDSGWTTQIEGTMPAGLADNIRGVRERMEEAINHGDATFIKSVSQGSPATVRGLFESKAIPFPVGQGPESISDFAIRKAQQQINAYGLPEKAIRAATQQRLELNPAEKDWTARLEAANKYVPSAIPSMVDEITKLSQTPGSGVGKDFWPNLVHTNNNLAADTAINTRHNELQALQQSLFPWGLKAGISMSRVGDLADSPEGAAWLTALRTHGQPAVMDALNDAGDRPIPLHNGLTLNQIAPPFDKNLIQDTFGVDFSIRTGMMDHPLQHLALAETGPAAQGTPATGVQVAPKGPTPSETLTNTPAPAASTAPTPLQSTADAAKAQSQNFTGSVPDFHFIPQFGHDSHPIAVPAAVSNPPPVNNHYNTVGDFFSAVKQQREEDLRIAHENNLPDPSLASTIETVAKNPNGTSSITPQVGIQAAHSIATFASMGDNIAGDTNPNSDVHKAIGVLSQTAAGAAAGSTFGPVGTAIGAAVGFTSGMISASRGTPQRSSEAGERYKLSQEQQQEQMRQTSIRDIRQRENDLARAAYTPAQRQNARNLVQQNPYTMRPTFGSRIGLVDQMERSLGSALTPRW